MLKLINCFIYQLPIIIIFSICFGIQPAASQNVLPEIKNSTYRLMLKMMYQKSVPLINVQEAAPLSKKGNTVFLDARERKEYEVSHIEGAKWIGYDTFQQKNVSDLDKSKPVVVYCSVGYRSERIGEQLLEMGFENVSNLYGGMFEWKNQGHAVFDQENNSTDKVHAYSKLWGIWLDNSAGIKEY